MAFFGLVSSQAEDFEANKRQSGGSVLLDDSGAAAHSPQTQRRPTNALLEVWVGGVGGCQCVHVGVGVLRGGGGVPACCGFTWVQGWLIIKFMSTFKNLQPTFLKPSLR